MKPKKEITTLGRIFAKQSNNGENVLLFRPSTDPSLMNWVKMQRYHYKKQNKVPGKYLTQDQIVLLDKMDFIWNVKEFVWNIRLTEIIQFRAKYGHSVVPEKYEYFPKLGKWVADVRYRKRIQAKEGQLSTRSLLTIKQISDLDALKFVWDVHDAKWLEKFHALKYFYYTHGHTHVTVSNCTDKSLLKWVQDQRYRCKMEERIKLLDSIGFIWSNSRIMDDKLKPMKKFA